MQRPWAFLVARQRHAFVAVRESRDTELSHVRMTIPLHSFATHPLPRIRAFRVGRVVTTPAMELTVDLIRSASPGAEKDSPCRTTSMRPSKG